MLLVPKSIEFQGEQNIDIDFVCDEEIADCGHHRLRLHNTAGNVGSSTERAFAVDDNVMSVFHSRITPNASSHAIKFTR